MRAEAASTAPGSTSASRGRVAPKSWCSGGSKKAPAAPSRNFARTIPLPAAVAMRRAVARRPVRTWSGTLSRSAPSTRLDEPA